VRQPAAYESTVRPLPASSRQRFERFRQSTLQPPVALGARLSKPLAQLERKLPRRYAEWVRPHAWALGRVIALSLVGIAIDMVWPLASAYLIDRVILGAELSPDQKLKLILEVAGGMVLLFGLGSAVGWVRSSALQILSSRFSFQLRQRLFQRVLRLPLSELDEMTTGGILSRLSTDVDSTAGLLQQALISPLLAGLRLLVTVSIVFSLNAVMAAMLLLVLPPVMLVQLRYSRRLRPIWRSMSQDRQDIDGRVSEGLLGVRVVRAFRRERLEELAYTQGHHTVMRKQLLATQVQRGIASIWELLLPLAQLVIVGFGGYLVIQGKTSVGVLVAFQAYLWRVFDPILQIANSISGTQRGLAALDRVCEVLDKPAELPDVPAALPAPRVVEELSFEHLSFAYGRGGPVISDFSLRVKGGSVVALVGASGAGKTTLTDLLARFRDPTEGRLRVNGIDLREIQLQSYRSLIGVVAQDVFLFDGTVAENIAYGARHASREEILEAARKAHAHEFIERLPDGYESVIGERGVKLSGGQRQRLSIARALLANPQILILDEATSNLDSESEHLIQESLRQLFARRTTFVIAHRLSTVVDADLIVVLERGRAVEVGTHPELLERRGTYYAMVQRQWRSGADGPALLRAEAGNGSDPLNAVAELLEDSRA
jgi:ATP-binding cassette subfamily B protein/subfamily B ATP-binding cassette protein MsbA